MTRDAPDTPAADEGAATITPSEFIVYHPTLDTTDALQDVLLAIDNGAPLEEIIQRLKIDHWSCPQCGGTYSTLEEARAHVADEEESTTAYPRGYTADNELVGLAPVLENSGMPAITPAVMPQSDGNGSETPLPFFGKAGGVTSHDGVTETSVAEPEYVSEVDYWFCPFCAFNLEDPHTGGRNPVGDVLRHIVLAGGPHDNIKQQDDDVFVLGYSRDAKLKALATIENSKIFFYKPSSFTPPHGTSIPAHWELKLTHDEVDPGEVGVEYWACPYCDEIDTNPSGEFIRGHITGQRDEAHDGLSGYNPDRPIFGYSWDHKPVAQMTPSRADIRADKSWIVEVKEGEGEPPSAPQQQRYTATAESKTPSGARIRVFNAWAAADNLETELVPAFGADAEFSARDIEAVTGIGNIGFIERVRFEREDAPESLRDPFIDDELRIQYRDKLRAIIRDRRFGDSTGVGPAPGPGGEVVDQSEVVSRIIEEIDGTGDVSGIEGVPVRFMGEFVGDEGKGGEEIGSADILTALQMEVTDVIEAINAKPDGGATPEEVAQREGMVKMGEFLLRMLDAYQRGEDGVDVES